MEEEARRVRQAAAMAAFRAMEKEENAAQYGKEVADAAMAKMRTRLETLKSLQVTTCHTKHFVYLHKYSASCTYVCTLRTAEYLA